MGTRCTTRRAAMAEEARPGEAAMDGADGMAVGRLDAGSAGTGSDDVTADTAQEGQEGIVRRIGFASIVRLDESRREIELCATSEAVDSYGTIFSYEASKDAFSRWIGNVREMHERKAVGRRVAVRCDDEARKVFVTIRISHGAQDTWEKVRDGTLRGASIGAANVKWQPRLFSTMDGKKLPEVAEKYDLVELSLVDNPSNPDAVGITFVRDAMPDATLLDRLDGEEPDAAARRNAAVAVADAENAEDTEPDGNHRQHRELRRDADVSVPIAAGALRATRSARPGAKAERSAEDTGSDGTRLDGERLHAAARAVLGGCGCAVCEAAMAALAPMADVAAQDGGEEGAEASRVREGEIGWAPEVRLAQALETSLRVSLWGSVRRLDALDEQVQAVRGAVDESGAAVGQVAEQVNRMARSVSETLAGALGRMGELGTRLERLEAQPMSGGPAARAVEKRHPLHTRGQTAGLAPSAEEQYRALEALAGRLADPQAQIAVAAELIRLQRERS